MAHADLLRAIREPATLYGGEVADLAGGSSPTPAAPRTSSR